MLADAELEDLRTRYVAAVPGYQQIVDHVVERLATAVGHRGVTPASIEGRVKDPSSFVKKLMRKDYAAPWADMRDKAGVRVTTVYAADVAVVDGVIADEFEVLRRDDKREQLAPDHFDYLGLHFEIAVPIGEGLSAADRVCEVQVRTGAETAWANASHDLLYKAPVEPGPEIKRGLHRLLALVELFDLEVTRTREAIMSHPTYKEGRLLLGLEQAFLGITAHRSDPELSRHVIDALRPVMPSLDWGEYRRLLDPFITSNRTKLERIYADYLADDRNPLISQPESLLVFERIEHDRFRLAEQWAQVLPTGMLAQLADIWGKPVDVDE
jgi:ppGpp synthetase/RelA/SpoT-type nucleotidyltranferase